METAPQPGEKPAIAQRDTLGRWLPGFTANTGNGAQKRRSAVIKIIDDLCGDHCAEGVEFAVRVMRGMVSQKTRKPGPGEDASSYALVPESGPTVRERLDAAIWLFEQRNGKAKASLTVEDETQPKTRITFDPSKLSDEELASAERLARKSAEHAIEPH
jgi:hypothetical protein